MQTADGAALRKAQQQTPVAMWVYRCMSCCPVSGMLVMLFLRQALLLLLVVVLLLLLSSSALTFEALCNILKGGASIL
jgi:hypothetical protein